MENFTIKADQEADLLLGWSELLQRELDLDQREEKLKRDQIRWMERDQKVGVREEAVLDREEAVLDREAAVAVREAEVAVREEAVLDREAVVVRPKSDRGRQNVPLRTHYPVCAPLRSSPLSESNRRRLREEYLSDRYEYLSDWYWRSPRGRPTPMSGETCKSCGSPIRVDGKCNCS